MSTFSFPFLSVIVTAYNIVKDILKNIVKIYSNLECDSNTKDYCKFSTLGGTWASRMDL